MMINGTRFRSAASIDASQRLGNAIAHSQAQISANRRILKPSDDPVADHRLTILAREGGNALATLQNLGRAASLAAQTDSVLGGVADIVGQAHQRLQAAANGTFSAQDRALSAVSIRAAAVDIDALSRTNDPAGHALFAAAQPVSIPVGDGRTVTPVPSRDAVFTPSINGLSQSIAERLNAAADALESGDATDIAAALDAIRAVERHIIQLQTDIGLTAERIDAMTQLNEEAEVDRAGEIAATDGFDLAATLANINSDQVNLQAVQAIYVRLNQSTLFDLLR